MSGSPPPLAYQPPINRKNSGCSRALLILIFGVLLVSVLAFVTKKSPDKKEVAGTVEVAAVEQEETKVQPLLDIPAIAGKAPAEVAGVLGKPEAEEETKDGPKHLFKNGSIEIVFINGKADWITVTPDASFPFSKKALAHLGIAATEPSINSASMIRWEPCGNYGSVAVFPKDGGNVDYVYIKVATK